MRKIRFNREIYSDYAISQTLDVYRHFAITTVEYEDDYAVIIFEKCRYDEEQTIKEFENYLIGVENS